MDDACGQASTTAAVGGEEQPTVGKESSASGKDVSCGKEKKTRRAASGTNLDAANNVALVKELLTANVPLARVVELFKGRIEERKLNAIAREVVEEGQDDKADLGILVLERSVTAARDPVFVEKHLENLKSEAPAELLDPLYYTLMKDPVVLSSGYVVDRSTALTEPGKLRFTSCPFTRCRLEPQVYPLVCRHRKVQEFKEKRLKDMITTADALLAEKDFKQFEHVMQVAESFLDDLGDDTYRHLARRLAETRLAAAEEPVRLVPPAELALSLVRVHRVREAGGSPKFDQWLKLLEEKSRQALADGRTSEASGWIQAAATVKRACLPTAAALPVERLRLALGKLEGDADLSNLQFLAWQEVRHDPTTAARFLAEEGLTEEALVDRRPLLLYRRRIADDTEDDAWRSALQSKPLETGVASVICFAGEFKDQGWGNCKGNLALALYDAELTLMARCNIFGTCRSPGYAYQPENLSRTLDAEEEVVSRAGSGCVYRLEYTVGSGGGHQIQARRVSIKVYALGAEALGPLSCEFKDPEGDIGTYRGLGDDEGRPHGLGELHYNQGDDIFTGLFEHGRMVEGTLYQGPRPRSAMRAGAWTDNDADPELVEKYPLRFIVIWEDKEGSSTSEEESDTEEDESEYGGEHDTEGDTF